MARAKGQAEFVQWMGPLLDALRELGGSASPRECSAWIAKHLKLPESVTEARLESGSERFHNQVQWARQYLVWEGLVDSPRRGIWTLTPKGAGTSLSPEESRKLFLKWVEIHAARREEAIKAAVGERELPNGSGKTNSKPIGGPTGPVSILPPGLEPAIAQEEEENELLSVLQSLPPAGFERVCKRLLHEHGLEQVEVTGRSHDGGIDGFGVLRLNPLITMKVSFQCKRVRRGVSRAQVGDFRNAVMGRADKGILITTGWFTADAEREAHRDGVIQIELVDGEKLLELCEEKLLGLKRKEVFEVDHSFFDQFRLR